MKPWVGWWLIFEALIVFVNTIAGVETDAPKSAVILVALWMSLLLTMLMCGIYLVVG